jgi:CheY-like chemotaxis protein
VQPDLVILCVTVDDLAGIQVLSMLKLDADTRDIPVLTYTTTRETEEPDDEVAEPAEPEMFTPKPAVWMN